MNTFALKRAAADVGTAGRPATERTLTLLETEDGWSLVDPDGKLAFRGLGTAARQQCLEFAREHGVLWVRT